MYIYALIFSWWSERVEAASASPSSGQHKGDGDRSEGPQGRGKWSAGGGATSVKMSGSSGERSKQEDW